MKITRLMELAEYCDRMADNPDLSSAEADNFIDLMTLVQARYDDTIGTPRQGEELDPVHDTWNGFPFSGRSSDSIKTLFKL